MRGMTGGIRTTRNSKYAVSLYELLKLSMNISKLPVCTTEQGVKIIKSSIKKLNDWCDISELIPSRFKKNNKLKKTGLCGLFSASLELTREGLISIMQKKNFERLLIKENNNEKR